jgi:hypothetical protein
MQCWSPSLASITQAKGPNRRLREEAVKSQVLKSCGGEEDLPRKSLPLLTF